MLKNKNILITGGTGFLGKNLVKYFLKTDIKKIVVFSRSEEKQFYMQKEINDDRVRFCIGDIRDISRLNQIMNDIDYVIHTAALKQVPIMEYNPFEAIMTNIIGTKNIIESACNYFVEKIIFISSDKANLPVNIYGATKFCSEKLMQYGYVYKENYDISLVCVRYGNVVNSTGSVYPVFKKLIDNKEKVLPLTTEKMTRFWFDVQGAIDLILLALEKGKSQDIFIPKLKSFYIKDLIKALNCEYKIIGKRKGEKIYENMINENEYYTDFLEYFIVNPSFNHVGFEYRSDKNKFMTVDDIKNELEKIK